jgi:hypothetical protein
MGPGADFRGVDEDGNIGVWEDGGTFGIEEGKRGIAGIDAELEGGFQACWEARRIEDGLPEGFEGYVDWCDVEKARDVGRGVGGIWWESERETCED